MTIRYKCPKCSAVLKIKDEKADQPAKCPACKAAFTVPGPTVSSAGPAADLAATGDDDEFVDMPLEPTPDVEMPVLTFPSGESDPMDVLNAALRPPTNPEQQEADNADSRRPTVTELMRDHQATRKKQAAARAKRQQIKVNSLLAEVLPAGSAADAITRRYDKKRGTGSDGPPMSREERRSAEQRKAFLRFTVQGAFGLVVAVGLAWGFFLLVWGGSDVDLVNVTGKITRQNQPVANVRIQFAPLRGPAGLEPPQGTSYAPSYARTNLDGEFTLLYDAETRGAVVGIHEVSIDDRNGSPILLPSRNNRQEVTVDGENHFEINL